MKINTCVGITCSLHNRPEHVVEDYDYRGRRMYAICQDGLPDIPWWVMWLAYFVDFALVLAAIGMFIDIYRYW